ncbi:MAG: hypothetical protein LUG12_12875 [Erysipelotrichaceae bacterium]|nr:hypothetical protein [Erysipelotrichaceae bacterium]
MAETNMNNIDNILYNYQNIKNDEEKLNETLIDKKLDQHKKQCQSLVNREIPIEWAKLADLMETMDIEMEKYIFTDNHKMHDYLSEHKNYLCYGKPGILSYHTIIENTPCILNIIAGHEDNRYYLGWHLNKHINIQPERSISFMEAITTAYDVLLETFDKYKEEVLKLANEKLITMKNENDKRLIDILQLHDSISDNEELAHKKESELNL